MKTIKFEINTESELCLTPCPVFAGVDWRHSKKGVQIGSITCQACEYNAYKQMDIENRIIVCKAQEEENEIHGT